jgi:superfamily II DNA or RNA helicase
VNRRRYAHILREQVLSARPFGSLSAAVTARIDLQPFQLEPALAMLRHARLRIFIADSVGLGKTIQAGLILSQLTAVDDTFRALIVVPAGLRIQWHEELVAKFSLSAIMADARWLVAMSRDLPADINPWALPGIYLASYDFLKQPEVLRALEDVRWDLMVADEVHGAGPGTARQAALQTLGLRSRRLVLLSATPPDSEPDALRAIADIGRFAGDPAATIFRRSRRDAGYAVPRRTALLPIRLSSAERQMHTRLDDYTARVWRESTARQDHAPRLAAMVLKKRALSTAASLLVSIRRRIVLLAGAPRLGEAQMRLPLFDEDPLPDDIDDAVLGAPGMADTETEHLLLTRIEEAAAKAAAVESKIRALRRLLRRAGEPTLVFTEYRDTVDQLAAAFASLRPLVLTGAMSPAERSDVQHAFAAGGSLLLSTDAASEGLNLHHRCRFVVHFELPWTPMRLEQRAGRVDRFGQVKKVHEVMLVARHTSERYVLGPLVRRIRAAAIAGVQTPLTSLSESTVASSVLGDTPLETPLPASGPLFEAMSVRSEAEAECDRIAGLRRLAQRGPQPSALASRGPAICQQHWRSGLVTVVLRVRIESGGMPIEDSLLPILAACSFGTAPNSRGRLRALVDELAQRLEPQLLASSEVMERVRHSKLFIRQALSALATRESKLAASYADWHETVQPGLFDRRAVRRAEARDRAAAQLIDETHTRVESLIHINLRHAFDIVAIHSGCGALR